MPAGNIQQAPETGRRSRSGVRASARKLLRGVGLLGPIYRLHEVWRASRFPMPPPATDDGIPLPDRLRMMRIGNTSDWRYFHKSGKRATEVIIDLARKAGAKPADWSCVLDWGCGCGRIARHMPKHTPARLVGRDIDAFTVRWCADNLVGDFRACSLSPPLDLASGGVDFAYGYSVISHLTGSAQRSWFAELGRLLKPGALIILTFHDPEHFAAPNIVVRSASDGVSVTEWVMEGSNLVAAFQTIDSIHAIAAPWFEPAEYIDSRSSPFDQAIAVLRRQSPAPASKGPQ